MLFPLGFKRDNLTLSTGFYLRFFYCVSESLESSVTCAFSLLFSLYFFLSLPCFHLFILPRPSLLCFVLPLFPSLFISFLYVYSHFYHIFTRSYVDTEIYTSISIYPFFYPSLHSQRQKDIHSLHFYITTSLQVFQTEIVHKGKSHHMHGGARYPELSKTVSVYKQCCKLSKLK